MASANNDTATTKTTIPPLERKLVLMKERLLSVLWWRNSFGNRLVIQARAKLDNIFLMNLLKNQRFPPTIIHKALGSGQSGSDSLATCLIGATMTLITIINKLVLKIRSLKWNSNKTKVCRRYSSIFFQHNLF